MRAGISVDDDDQQSASRKLLSAAAAACMSFNGAASSTLLPTWLTFKTAVQELSKSFGDSAR